MIWLITDNAIIGFYLSLNYYLVENLITAKMQLRFNLRNRWFRDAKKNVYIQNVNSVLPIETQKWAKSTKIPLKIK